MKSCAIFTGIDSVVCALNERECGASGSASLFDRFFDRFRPILTIFFHFFERALQKPYLRPISARNTGDKPTKFAQATYGNLTMPNMEWNFRWRAKNMDGWILRGDVKNPACMSVLDFLHAPSAKIHIVPHRQAHGGPARASRPRARASRPRAAQWRETAESAVAPRTPPKTAPKPTLRSNLCRSESDRLRWYLTFAPRWLQKKCYQEPAPV